MRLHVIADIGSEVVVGVGVVGIFDVELREQRLAVGSCREAR